MNRLLDRCDVKRFIVTRPHAAAELSSIREHMVDELQLSRQHTALINLFTFNGYYFIVQNNNRSVSALLDHEADTRVFLRFVAYSF